MMSEGSPDASTSYWEGSMGTRSGETETIIKEVSIVNGYFRGHGSDGFGQFIVSGNASKKGKVSFCKQYTNGKSGFYRGQLSEDTTRCEGRWGWRPGTLRFGFSLGEVESPDLDYSPDQDLDEAEMDMENDVESEEETPVIQEGSMTEKPETTELREMREFVQGIIDSGEQWTDPEFPPEQCSLWDEFDNGTHEGRWGGIGWTRATELYDSP